MGNGMNKVLPGLYLGNFRDAKDTVQLSENKITHILSIHDNSRPILMDKIYLCIPASDSPNQNISQYFSQCNDFIHNARVNGGGVLVHCLAGVSRSVSIVVAYVMTVTDLGWRDSMNAVRASRTCASPNFGFQRQLLEFQHENLLQERERLKAKYPSSPYPDIEECHRLLEINSEWVTTGHYGKQEEDGVSKLEDQMSSLLCKNTENLQKMGNLLQSEDDLPTDTSSKACHVGDGKSNLPSDSVSVDGVKLALDDSTGLASVKTKPNDMAKM